MKRKGSGSALVFSALAISAFRFFSGSGRLHRGLRPFAQFVIAMECLRAGEQPNVNPVNLLTFNGLFSRVRRGKERRRDLGRQSRNLESRNRKKRPEPPDVGCYAYFCFLLSQSLLFGK